MFNEKREIFEAKGELKDKEDNEWSPANLSIWQYFDGSLKAVIKIPQDLGEFTINGEKRFDFEGENSDGYLVCFEDGGLVNPLDLFKDPAEIGIKPLEFEVKLPDMEDSDSELFLKFGITNFRNHKEKVDMNTELADIDFINLEINGKDHNEIITEIKNNPLSCVTTEVRWENLDMDTSEPINCLERAEKEMMKILNLSSFAQGIYQSFAFSKVFQNTDSGEELIYANFYTPIRYTKGFKEVIHKFNVKEYLSETYPNYDNLDERMGLNIANLWYVDSLRDGNISSKYLKGFTCLETLVSRFAIANNLEVVTDPDDYKDFFNQEIQPVVSPLLKQFGLEDSEKRGDIYDSMRNASRYSLKTKLERLLEEYKIGYKDLFSDLTEITKTRNKIVHEGRPKDESSEVYDKWEKMMCLNQRIILSLLEYDGGTYRDWIDEKIKKFNRDPQNQYS